MYHGTLGACAYNISCKVDIYVVVRAQSSGIYGSKPTRVQGHSPRTRAVYVAINPWQLGSNFYISHLIGPQCGAHKFSSIATLTVNKPAKK